MEGADFRASGVVRLAGFALRLATSEARRQKRGCEMTLETESGLARTRVFLSLYTPFAASSLAETQLTQLLTSCSSFVSVSAYDVRSVLDESALIINGSLVNFDRQDVRLSVVFLKYGLLGVDEVVGEEGVTVEAGEEGRVDMKVSYFSRFASIDSTYLKGNRGVGEAEDMMMVCG